MPDIYPLSPPTGYPGDTRPFADRTLLITGAGAGIGRATAVAAAAAGATVVLLDNQVSALEAVYDEIEAGGHPQPAIYPLDLLGAAPDDHAVLAERLDESFGGLHGLLHNAAELGKPAPLAHYQPESWLRTLQVNLNAPFLLTRACLPLLLRSEAARVVFVSDAAGREGRAYQGAYGVAKFGLEGLMQTLTAELPADSPLAAASLDPGPCRTALRRHAYPAEDPAAVPPPDRAARALLYLLDPAQPVDNGRAYVLT